MYLEQAIVPRWRQSHREEVEQVHPPPPPHHPPPLSAFTQSINAVGEKRYACTENANES